MSPICNYSTYILLEFRIFRKDPISLARLVHSQGKGTIVLEFARAAKQRGRREKEERRG